MTLINKNFLSCMLFCMLVVGGCNSSKLCSNSKGIVAFGDKATSPNGKMYAREVEPKDYGRIGIYDRETDQLLKILDVQQDPRDTPNDLKGLAWSPDSKFIAVMYHHSGGGTVFILDVQTGNEVRQVPIDKYYRCVDLLPDGKIEAWAAPY